jgi:2-polyprenyl-3-methyl-5-hydroxy-6-metoxy-1,4-benzoquinol methylase
MNEFEVEKFWNQYPCGEMQVGGLRKYKDEQEFFLAYDKFRYSREAHILKCLDNIEFNGKNVLEIGLGQGADSEQMIKRGAIWSGLDLTQESVDRVKNRLHLRQLQFKSIRQGSILQIPDKENTFDIVFAHGVLHHVPEILTAQREIHRILQPNGELIIMLYARWSLNYLISIGILRRLGLLGLYFTNRHHDGILGRHLENAHIEGIWNYLKMKNFIHKNTDGPLNPYSKVYDLEIVKKDFPDFKIIRSYKQFMHAPPLPVSWMPLARVLGWHLWVHLQPLNK